MQFAIIAVGHLKERALRQVLDDYLARIRRVGRLTEVELKNDAGLEQHWPEDAVVVACEVDGKALSSSEFSAHIDRWTSTGKGKVAFLIGGAEGLPAELSRRADFRLSLSTMTLPHRLARVLLAEQIYRALSILRGEPYAREG